MHFEAKVEAGAGDEAVAERLGLAEVEFEYKDGDEAVDEAIDFTVDTGSCQ